MTDHTQAPSNSMSSTEVQERPCDSEDGVHDWREERYRYGEDADGNRGIWVYCERCAICGEER